jgi:hypothetical protein
VEKFNSKRRDHSECCSLSIQTWRTRDTQIGELNEIRQGENREMRVKVLAVVRIDICKKDTDRTANIT